MIKKVRIKNFKCFKDWFELDLNGGINILVGNNEEGKSTILEAIHLALTGFDSKGKRYYQITALDEYSRRRVCKIVDEKSVTHTATFLLTLEEEMGFNITIVQTDNGSEFTNEMLNTNNKSIFEQILDYKGIKYQRTRPYSPWQNGKVERSHREDSKWYEKHVFAS